MRMRRYPRRGRVISILTTSFCGSLTFHPHIHILVFFALVSTIVAVLITQPLLFRLSPISVQSRTSRPTLDSAVQGHTHRKSSWRKLHCLRLRSPP
ncbi:hypothetical protein F5J12DRAFT_500501 [Pisolithus orientalis]|uniref:uncharacterized protein n=1 Tax=Pisolithus orientalis TaxID=936130 RepID=UPI00222566F9|nr:uncharacterized protein F5J12DRAFT_500501 [Pisolithus orientalis]KAI5989790.1 hypothetical protein F5J12DRAFT_500501 [Pisolithus orientalis]